MHAAPHVRCRVLGRSYGLLHKGGGKNPAHVADADDEESGAEDQPMEAAPRAGLPTELEGADDAAAAAAGSESGGWSHADRGAGIVTLQDMRAAARRPKSKRKRAPSDQPPEGWVTTLHRTSGGMPYKKYRGANEHSSSPSPANSLLRPHTHPPAHQISSPKESSN